MRRKWAVFGGAATILAPVTVLLIWPAAAYADGSFLPYPGQLSPFGKEPWFFFYLSVYGFAAIAIILGLVWLRRIAHRNRADSADRRAPHRRREW